MPIIQELIRDDYTFEQAELIQIKYQKFIKEHSINSNFLRFEKIKTVAGVDVSYFYKDNYEYGVACAVLWNLKENKMESYYTTKEPIIFPYKPGFLGFREVKILAKVISKLPYTPDLIMCDGHGKIHPKQFGEATHLGVALNIPTIGIAKNPYIGYSNWKEIKTRRGNKSPIWVNNPDNFSDPSLNKILGYAICLNDGLKPVFISEGYRIKINTALEISLKTTKKHRQPEPIYLSDFVSRKEIKNLT
ncbi:MAG: endonuclease V [Promethearchaeota archaeon]